MAVTLAVALWGYVAIVAWVQEPVARITPTRVPAKTYARLMDGILYAVFALPGVVVAAFLSAWWCRRRSGWETRCRKCGEVILNSSHG